MLLLIPFPVTKVDVFVTVHVTKTTLLPPSIKSTLKFEKFWFVNDLNA
jgi:hypothetical protein